jgi:hypothetical protein
VKAEEAEVTVEGVTVAEAAVVAETAETGEDTKSSRPESDFKKTAEDENLPLFFIL